MDQKIHSIEKLLFVPYQRHTAFNGQISIGLVCVFVRGSFPQVGTNPRLPVLPALLDFSMHISRKRLILYSDTKSAAFI